MEIQQDGRFSFGEIHQYLTSRRFPGDFRKSDKHTLQKRAKSFLGKETQLFYVGGSTKENERLVVEDCS